MTNFKGLNIYNKVTILSKVRTPPHHSAVKWINHLAKFVSRHFRTTTTTRTTTAAIGKLACNARQNMTIETNGKQYESSTNQMRIK